MFIIHTLQREEESLVLDCQQYCLEHLVNRLYEPEATEHGHAGGHRHSGGSFPSGLTERVAR
jgi:hypothetical protein